jgi:glycosyltransferase involved in cell wall biosynthesis
MIENQKMKVVWLCYFTNEEIQNIIKPSKGSKECCPYVPSTIKILENIKNIQLYIISPHEHIGGVRKFSLRGVNYFFYNAHIPFIGRHWPNFFKWDLFSNYFGNKRIVKRIVNKIQPNIIHLQGAEVAYYSSTILQFMGKYPTILTPQGFISKTTLKLTKLLKKRIKVELEIIKGIGNSFYRTDTMKEDLIAIKQNIKLFWGDYPYVPINCNAVENKIYDIVFFAKVTKEKGFGDLLESLAILKNKFPNISLLVIGSGNIEFYKIKVNELGLTNNITWAGFLPTQADVHKMASQAKISVLPTYHDIISGTILESLFLKLPVVAYNVGSIHEVNEKEEIISLVDKLDVGGLAKAIEFLLDNPEIQKDRAERGYQRAQEMFVHSDDEIRDSLLDAYYSVIQDFKKA